MSGDIISFKVAASVGISNTCRSLVAFFVRQRDKARRPYLRRTSGLATHTLIWLDPSEGWMADDAKGMQDCATSSGRSVPSSHGAREAQ
jgi:hypothetical protein